MSLVDPDLRSRLAAELTIELGRSPSNGEVKDRVTRHLAKGAIQEEIQRDQGEDNE
ncbi:MAG TPA: hypothetical protein VGE34_01055 [Candidatus Saccharimonadales bacterium]